MTVPMTPLPGWRGGDGNAAYLDKTLRHGPVEEYFGESVGWRVVGRLWIRAALCASVVGLASFAVPPPEHLAAAVVEAVSPGRPDQGIAGAAAVAVRACPGELDTAWANVTALNVDPPPAAHVPGHAPEAVGELERALGAIVDVDEAASAFRLPYPVLG